METVYASRENSLFHSSIAISHERKKESIRQSTTLRTNLLKPLEHRVPHQSIRHATSTPNYVSLLHPLPQLRPFSPHITDSGPLWKVYGNREQIGDSYLKHTCVKRLADLIESDSNTESQTEESSSAAQLSQDSVETELESTYCKTDYLVKCEYHVVYSVSYSVPVLYFNISHANGSLLTLNEVWSMFRGKKSLITDADMWSTLSQQDHPVLNLPFFTIHPCHTSRLMGTLWNYSRDPPLSYLITWLSVVGGRLGLKVPNELGLYLASPEKPEGS
ncbi:unnamed protein product [Allacma fusca]|uniref:Ubiquitin-like-conjugating enzyme ATG10 n=1 Tax=Allacma fusca TaxID=39272 RepID=A0A8J2PEX7_9HEXA|nr:unnamed protein product [Allacma fusca]